jgi:hypothetical protein
MDNDQAEFIEHVGAENFQRICDAARVAIESDGIYYPSGRMAPAICKTAAKHGLMSIKTVAYRLGVISVNVED